MVAMWTTKKRGAERAADGWASAGGPGDGGGPARGAWPGDGSGSTDGGRPGCGAWPPYGGRPTSRDGPTNDERGQATIESAGLAALIALLLIAVIAALASGGVDSTAGRELARAIGRRIVCSPHLPDACHHQPLVPAYGWPLARLARALAPAPAALLGPDGLPLVPVDFRRCRRASCAVDAGPHLTASNRRTTDFTQLLDRRRSAGTVELVYWEYRPTIGWRAVRRTATRADVEAAAGTGVWGYQDPVLVPLETLPGHNHYDFPAAETPPWQWHVEARYPGWSD